MIQLPEQTSKKWQQSNSSDVFGNVAVTKNITFDKGGYLQLSASSRAVMNETTDADFDEPAVIVRSQDHGYFVETHDSAFEVDADKILGVRPAQSVTAGVPTGDLQSDATFVGGLLVVTQDTDVDYYDPTANTWTDTNISLTATAQSQHPIEKFLSLAAFAIADVNTVKLYSVPITATPTLLVTLTILADFYITGMAYFNQNLYIGTMNRFGGNAFLYVWNGYGTAAQSAYEVDSNIIYDVCVHQDSVTCVTGAGQLLRFNGSGFTVLDNFPIFYSDQAMSDETNINMYHNCLKSSGDVLYINFNNDQNDTILTNQPSGIWCYDSKLGFLYHKYSRSNSLVLIDAIAQGDVNTTTNQITVAAAPITGTEVILNILSASAPAPLVDGTRYYAIKIDATHIQLATTKALALAGTPIDITAQSSGATSLVSFPNIDFGQYHTSRNAAICSIQRIITQPQYGADIIWGGDLYGRTLSTQAYLGSVSSGVENRGYFITPWIDANAITDRFHHVGLRFSKFKSDIDKIIVKYRLYDDRRDTIYVAATTDWKATWTSSTTFTTTQADFANAIVGDEVEFLRGAASGLLAHITVISSNAGTYTVTIDEEFEQYTSNDVSTFVFRNWKKLEVISSDAKLYWDRSLGPTFQGTRIQFKVELRGIGTRIESFMLNNKSLLTLAK